MGVIISGPNRTARVFLGSIYRSCHGSKFKYDGRFVLSHCFIEPFRFSHDLQGSVKKNMSSDIADEAQILTLRFSSQESTQKDQVTLQTVQYPGLTFCSDDIVQPDVKNPVRICISHSRSP